MKIYKSIIILTVLSLAGTAYFFGRLPDQIALHYNYKGEVDNWGSRNYIWLFSSLPLFLYGLMALIPLIDPRKDSYEKHKRAYSILANALVLFLVALNWFTIAVSLGVLLNIQIFILVAIGILWIIIGNYLPTARQNYTFGIRTPWTLADNENWRKTHRFAGICFILTGIIALICAFIPGLAALIIFFSATILMISVIFLFSCITFRKK